jgi:hypothetical protein
MQTRRGAHSHTGALRRTYTASQRALALTPFAPNRVAGCVAKRARCIETSVDLALIALGTYVAHLGIMKWGLPCLLFVAGCAHDYATGARTQVASDLNCPVEQTWAYEEADRSMVAGGCGDWHEYRCHVERINKYRHETICVRLSSQHRKGARPPGPAPEQEPESDPYHPADSPPGWHQIEH